MPERVAIIPARGGSKGVPGKNKRVVGGRPLIAWSLSAAREAQSIDRIIVTTDDPDIAAIARAEGAEVVDRPDAHAGDASPVIDAVLHALETIGLPQPAAVALLQPTSPIRTGADIDAALALFERTGVPVCSVCRAEDAHPARMYRVEDGHLRALVPELAALRRQDLPPVYHRNGALYVFGPRQLERREIIADDMLAYEMPGECAINIDTELDLMLLEAFLARRA
jgi:CMP-N-acetylneuraminic acid synthetase